MIDFNRALLFLFFICALLSSCSHPWTTRTPGSQSKKILVVFVNGISSDVLIPPYMEFAKKNNEDIERASFGEFASVFEELRKKENINFVNFRYLGNRSNLTIGFDLNQMLLKNLKTKEVDEIHFITLSNGSLVLREAMVQALGLTDKVVERFAKEKGLKKSSQLLDLYKKSIVHDVAPITAGPADARGAAGLPKYSEINPFGKHMNWLYSEEVVLAVNTLIQDRFTYVICGDSHSRGIWNQLINEQRSSGLDKVFRLSALAQGHGWKKENLNWFLNFERSRGKDRDHHVEFVSDLPKDSYCSYAAYVEKQEKFIDDLVLKANGPLVLERLNERKSLANDGFYAQKIRPVLKDFDIKTIRDLLVKNGEYKDKILLNFYKINQGSVIEKKNEELELLDRHTVLVFYRPLIKMISNNIEK